MVDRHDADDATRKSMERRNNNDEAVVVVMMIRDDVSLMLYRLSSAAWICAHGDGVIAWQELFAEQKS